MIIFFFNYLDIFFFFNLIYNQKDKIISKDNWDEYR